MTDVCKFKFLEKVGKKTIEKEIARAIETAEYTFGQAKVRLHAGYLATNDKAVIDASSEVGEYIAQIFIGLMTRKLGEDKFTVERIRRSDEL
ncbi:MAG: hypothetical protein A2Y00_05390 [Omnitrophica WOR_2 bacterium GWF2_43_52]|jgi:hypothetical protein|nr:MAG: hypothetical protein A2Y01_02135 [Omnitrophica WOR_2 bacterium GWC2_44_8]OGX20533.1 MAG: hypothetical protein A2Y00_05390 [Omnitrophica WOR_2 bacterium GWF2_43_52]HAH21651.1 hypothetical protein [Candidatus Omnitrophota bacterium]HBG64244.1 hypothetical protein [Candidatus Omnitrophota bacterium]